MVSEQKKLADAKYEKDKKILFKIDVFLLITLVSSFFFYYNILNMFVLPQELAVHISLAVGVIFAGLLFLSFRTHKKKETKQQ